MCAAGNGTAYATTALSSYRRGATTLFRNPARRVYAYSGGVLTVKDLADVGYAVAADRFCRTPPAPAPAVHQFAKVWQIAQPMHAECLSGIFIIRRNKSYWRTQPHPAQYLETFTFLKPHTPPKRADSLFCGKCGEEEREQASGEKHYSGGCQHIAKPYQRRHKSAKSKSRSSEHG